MTEAERAFEAWDKSYCASSVFPVGTAENDRRAAFLAGWKRERVRAKPMMVECIRRDFAFDNDGDVLNTQMIRWLKDIPEGTKFRVTVEEVESTGGA